MSRARCVLHILLAVALLSPFHYATGDADDDGEDARNYRQARSIVASRRFYLSRDDLDYEPKFCSSMLASFRSAKLDVRRPIVVATDPGDIRLDSYKQRCPSVGFFGWVALSHVFFEQTKRLTREQRERELARYGTIYEGQPPFRLYEVKRTASRTDGSGYVLFSPSSYGPVRLSGALAERDDVRIAPQQSWGGYKILDVRGCEATGLLQLVDPGDTTVPARELYHGIVRFRGRDYVYALNSYFNEKRDPHYSLYFHGDKPGHYYLSVCGFLTDRR